MTVARRQPTLRIVLLTTLAVLVWSGDPGRSKAAGEDTRLSVREVEVALESLFVSAAYDSILSLIPGLLEESEVRGDSVVLGRILKTRGRVELAQGRVVDCEKTLDRSIEVAVAVRDTNTWVDALGFKAFAVAWQGRQAESMNLQREKLDLAQLSHNRIGEAWARTGIAYLNMLGGELGKAKQHYTKSIHLMRAVNDRRSELTPLIGLGRVFHNSGDLDGARECYQRAWISAKELGDAVQQSHAVNNLGTLEFSNGDMGRAADYFERAYKLQRSVGHGPESVTSATNVAIARSYLGEYAEAAAILTEAIDTCERLGNRALLGATISDLADVRFRQGRTGVAAALFRSALAMGEALSANDRNQSMLGLATCLVDLDSSEVAVGLLDRALSESPSAGEPRSADAFLILSLALRKTGRPGRAVHQSREAERLSRELGDTWLRVAALLELSSCYRQTGRADSARTRFDQAIDTARRRRQAITEHEWREASGQTFTTGLIEASHILLDQPPDRPRPQRVEELFDVLQQFKAQTLIERITEPRQLAEPPAGLSGVAPVTLRELQTRILRPGELLLDFIVARKEGFLFAVTRDSCRITTVPGYHTSVTSTIDLYCKTLGSRIDGPLGEAPPLGQMRAAVGRLVLGEVQDLVAKAARIIVAPDAYLSTIPFGTLTLADEPGEGPMLLAEKEIEQVPSATVLKLLRTRPARDPQTHPDGRLLALAPRTGDELPGALKEVDAIRRGYSGVELVRGLARDQTPTLEEMLGEYEIIHIAAHIEVSVEKPWNSGILLGRYTPGSETQPDTPGETPVSNGGERSVDRILSREDALAVARELRTDSYLRAGEIAGLRIPARLAVLSGCESAMGQLTLGQGVLGLTAAFLSAGVTAVVATQWPVDDLATADLMKVFYRELAEGRTVAGALRAAQLAVRRRPATRHPFYWAGFVVVGDGTATVGLREKGRNPGLISVLALAGIAVLVMLIGIRRKKVPLHV